MQSIEKANDINQSLVDTSEMDGKYLTFWTDEQLFGIPINDVVQIVGIQPISVIPEFPNYVKGIINLQGNIIPLIDVRLRFGKEEMEYTKRTSIIVSSIHEMQIGFIVDEVNEVADINESDVLLPPKLSEGFTISYITGIDMQKEKMVFLLDAAKMATDDVEESLTQSGCSRKFLRTCEDQHNRYLTGIGGWDPTIGSLSRLLNDR